MSAPHDDEASSRRILDTFAAYKERAPESVRRLHDLAERIQSAGRPEDLSSLEEEASEHPGGFALVPLLDEARRRLASG